ncbi:flagellar basal-body rod protein FlgF [Desulfurispirillum indicum]|uniref:Flagellar hook-basal body protein n=1 Tax=Desulfurispirillum indicum (strain ATCC BAA-1389 / DSM 22839 / S5) TaxID=653733 RepID=E6W048_DESIS|nr:flagellar basal-body rod protein FlgF [Desulfurispirillum indicum]ADU65174.1 flagellar hook-basal body protein [Desulfurispirillum indicum S5]UCZ57065.1 flagellar basal-body rod protein FlgF [Desulfurispirillum indicum]
MVNGLYTSASGMVLQSRKLDASANNLANVNTVGFKKDIISVDNFRAKSTTREEDAWRRTLFNETINNTHNIAKIHVDHSQGALHQTGNSLDVGINGNAFLVVDTPFGERYTRGGNLQIDSEGRLTTKEGYPLKAALEEDDAEGPAHIFLPEASDIIINAQGEIFVDEEFIATLSLVRFEDERDLRKVGFNQLARVSADVEAYPAEHFELHQGYLESSNVNIVREMTDMVELNRSFSAYQKMISSIDETVSTLLQAGKSI